MRNSLQRKRINRLLPPANEEEPVQRHYSLGDKVYLGVKEYEILAIDDHMVRLYDSEYPLFNEELSRSDFDRRIAENPLNDQPKESSGEQTADVKPLAVGRLDYLDSNGHVGEQVEYDDETQLVEQVKGRRRYRCTLPLPCIVTRTALPFHRIS